MADPATDLPIIHPALAYKFREDINVGDNPEYFIAMGQQHQHSFLLIGVLIPGDPATARTLARVAKTWDIDPGKLAGSRFADFNVFKSNGIISRLGNEMYTSPASVQEEEIYSEAHQITFAQLEELLVLLREVEVEQLKDTEVQKGVQKLQQQETNEFYEFVERKDVKSQQDINLLSTKKPIYQGIVCYVPHEGGKSFTYQKLSEYNKESPKEQLNIAAKEITGQVIRLDTSNSCRTSALNILNIALDYKTRISKYFFKTLSSKSILKGGQFKPETLWILPPPPNACSETKNLSPIKTKALQKMYNKLTRLAEERSQGKDLRAKFDDLKSLYIKMAGSSKVSVSTLLEQIAKHKESLFKSRGLFSKIRDYLGMKSETHKLLTGVLKDLRDENNTPSPTLKS